MKAWTIAWKDTLIRFRDVNALLFMIAAPLLITAIIGSAFGNFFDDTNTSITNQSSGIYAYYYIDDVCLSTDSTYAHDYITSILEIEKRNDLRIFPNPASDRLKLEFDRTIDVKIEDMERQRRELERISQKR